MMADWLRNLKVPSAFIFSRSVKALEHLTEVTRFNWSFHDLIFLLLVDSSKHEYEYFVSFQPGVIWYESKLIQLELAQLDYKSIHAGKTKVRRYPFSYHLWADQYDQHVLYCRDLFWHVKRKTIREITHVQNGNILLIWKSSKSWLRKCFKSRIGLGQDS